MNHGGFFRQWLPQGLPWWLSCKKSAWQCKRYRRHGFHPWVGKIPWRKKWQPTPVFLPRNWQCWTRLSRHAMTSSVPSCWFTSKLLCYSSPPPFFWAAISGTESFFWVPNMIGCAIIPISMLNAHWPLSSWLSKNTRWLTNMFRTGYIWVTTGQ